MPSSEQGYTPALGIRALTPFFDFAVLAFTREHRWRPALVRQISPEADERILDIGCGTGTLTRALARAAPGATIIGVDPDPDILRRARSKAVKAGLDLAYVQGFFVRDFADCYGPFSKIVSSLVLHQVPLETKRAILSLACRTLIPGGEIHIADYGLQRTPLMRLLFRNLVQRIDGIEDTAPNAGGILPELMREAGFSDVEETDVVPTATGSISLYRGVRRSASR